MPQRDDFLGQWQIARRIDDRLTGQTGLFDGQARLTQAGSGLHYAEEGVLRFGQAAGMRAERAYLWDFNGTAVTVRFADGRDFHQFRAEGLSTGSDHPCGADLYRVVYDFTRWPDWQAQWDVRGPRKEYSMVSRYSR